jgi:hypothetical protein
VAHARNAWLDDLALASRGGPQARRMLVGAWAVERAGVPLASAADGVEGRADQGEGQGADAGRPDGGGRPVNGSGPSR